MPASDRDEALKELGRIARERREEASLSLEDVYERTRVRIEFLQGIEQGNYQGFPDLVYIKGFVRTYLSVVGADELKDEFLSWLNKEFTKEHHLPPTNVLGDSTFPTKGFKPASHFWLFALLLMILLGAGGYVWYSWANSPISITDIRPYEPNVAPPTPGGVVSGDKASKDAAVPASSDSKPLSILPVSASVAPVPKQEPAKPYILIKARGDVWMKVMIGDKVLYSQTLKSGTETSWDLSASAKVTFGRPNMAEVVLNGKNLGIVNSKGSKKSETYLYDLDGSYKKLQ